LIQKSYIIAMPLAAAPFVFYILMDFCAFIKTEVTPNQQKRGNTSPEALCPMENFDSAPLVSCTASWRPENRPSDFIPTRFSPF
jgi:hypothetical protein